MGRRWQPIRDYETDPEQLASRELQALSSVWIEQKTTLGESHGIAEFNERLKREWAIETGLIERLYTLDRGITELLIEHGVSASLIPRRAGADPQQAAALIQDQVHAVDSLFSFAKGERKVSTSYIKELHSLFTRHQEYAEGRDQFGRKSTIPLLRGDYKQRPNNPTRTDGSVHEYCPVEHVAAEMDRLCDLHREHVQNDVAPEVEAAWLHHRFVQIHPFQDGNGRLARALATLIFIKADWLPLVVRDDQRSEYIQALEDADDGNLQPLVSLFAAIQKRQFINVIGIARDMAYAEQVEARIQAISQRLAARQDAPVREWEKAVSNAERLRVVALERVKEVQAMLEEAVGDFHEFAFFVDAEDDDGERSHYFRRQIVATAKSLSYYANTRRHRSWVRLVIRDGSQSQMLFSFHGIGQQFQGVLACSATWLQHVPMDGGTEPGGDAPLCDDVFQINYREDVADIELRFRSWLERALERGLAMWQQTSL